jgi:polar amino acid transport system substrate-binding protein
MTPISPEVLKDLAPSGTLRAAINLGNPVLVQRDAATGALSGITIDLAHELARRLGVAVTLIPFDTAGKVSGVAAHGVWDVAFLAVDPARAVDIRFTEPYVIIEGTYVVASGSPDRTVEDVDRPGVKIAVVSGAAYDLYLSRTLKHAQLVRAATFEDQMALFVAERLDASAGVRQPIEAFARSHPGYRVTQGRFTEIRQAMGTPQGREAGGRYLDAFIEQQKADGFVAAALARSGQGEVTVAPPARGA